MSDLSAIEWEVRRIGPTDAADMLNRIAASGHVDKLTLEAFERDMRSGMVAERCADNHFR